MRGFGNGGLSTRATLAIIATSWLAGFLIFGSIVYAAQRVHCAAVAEAMGTPWRFGLLTGCMVTVRDRWVPLEQRRSVE